MIHYKGLVLKKMDGNQIKMSIKSTVGFIMYFGQILSQILDYKMQTAV